MERAQTDDRWKWHQKRGKRQYTRREAFDAKRELWKSHRRKVYPYKCEICGKWHLTSRRQRIDFKEAGVWT